MKVVLVIEEPLSCMECPCSEQVGYCNAVQKWLENPTIPQWCPLKPMPMKREPKEEWLNEYRRDEFADGWNACLQEFTKSDAD